MDIRKHADSGFKKEAWVACCDTIKEVIGETITIDKYKAKVDSMKAL